MNHSAPAPAENIAFGSATLPTSSAYEAPAVIYEAPLEVRAGSPLGIPDPVDLD